MIEWTDVVVFRDLYSSLLQYQRHQLYYDVLVPWLDRSRTLMEKLSPFRLMGDLKMNDEEKYFGLWTFYALSRVSDQLLLPFQAKPHQWDHPAVTQEEYAAFFDGMGFSVVHATTADVFAPFQHEIVEVEQSANNNDPVLVLDGLWPGLRFGEMLFARCGVIVAGGSNHVVKEVAESSTLYFTHRRLHRDTFDLSYGWGHNSQWRTAIRRDYESGNRRYCNVDGATSIATLSEDADRDRLIYEERLELCRNRCFIRTTKPQTALSPFDDRYEEECPL